MSSNPMAPFYSTTSLRTSILYSFCKAAAAPPAPPRRPGEGAGQVRPAGSAPALPSPPLAGRAPAGAGPPARRNFDLQPRGLAHGPPAAAGGTRRADRPPPAAAGTGRAE